MSEKNLRREVKALRQLIKDVYDDAYEIYDEYGSIANEISKGHRSFNAEEMRAKGLYDQAETTVDLITAFLKKEKATKK